MKAKLLPAVKFLAVVLLLLWYGLFLAQKIDLSTADLGRHIRNGQIVLSEGLSSKVLNTNFYSYSNPDFLFINHHWGSGVVFYLVDKIAGFEGLSVLYILFGIATLWLFFDAARKASNIFISLALAILLIPIMASRAEVRPEMFTYFFSGVFFWILWNYRESIKNYPEAVVRGRVSGLSVGTGQTGGEKFKSRWLWTLPLFSLVWVNLHIGFFMGTVIIGAFVLDDIKNLATASGRKQRHGPDYRLLAVGLVSVLAAFCNPNFIKGALYPLQIFRNYGYLIVENQSVSFLEKLQFTEGMHFLLFKICLGALILSFAGAAFKNWRKVSLPMFLISIAVSAMAVVGIRNFPFFGFFALPAIACNFQILFPGGFFDKSQKTVLSFTGAVAIPVLIFVIAVGLLQGFQTLSGKKGVFGIGLFPEINRSAEFYIQNNLKGPIFNNYDIGGYLIYHLFGKEKVFVDNRPEAYPDSFFKEVYIPAQENKGNWQELEEKYRFNSIFFSYRDYTPWGQAFLISRVQDSAWAPVFADGFNTIFLKRSPQNAELIKRFELPKSMFRVKQTQ